MKRRINWRAGTGEMISTAIIVPIICALLVSIVSSIQLTTSLSALSKITRVAARTAALQEDKSEAVKSADKAVQLYTSGKVSSLTNVKAKVDYADSDKTLYLVSVSANISGMSSSITNKSKYTKKYVVAIEKQLSSWGGENADLPSTAVAGQTITIPSAYGSSFTHTRYDHFFHKWDHGTMQRKLALEWDRQGRKSVDRVATIDGLYLVATTPTFGNCGDMIKCKLSNGKTLNCIIADTKDMTDAGCNKYGHDNGQTVIETESLTDKDYPWGRCRVEKITNMGKYLFHN